MWTTRDEWYLREAQAMLAHWQHSLSVCRNATTFLPNPKATGQYIDLIKREEQSVARLLARKEASRSAA